MVQSILSNLAIILLGHLLMSTLMNYRGRFTKVTLNCSIVLLFSTVVIAMFYLPIRFDANYQVDLRLIPLLLLAIFRGWKITLPVLVISSAWRLGMGGWVQCRVYFMEWRYRLYSLYFIWRLGKNGFQYWKVP